MALLMCRPDAFEIEYEINPWMHVATKVDHQLAMAQWETLVSTYRDLGEKVDLVDPVSGLPDMVFTANAGLIYGSKVILSSFRHRERRGEEPLWTAAFEERGYRVYRLPGELTFEGAGDALFAGDRLFVGHGFRTDRAAHSVIAALLDVEVVSLELIDPRFYHLDTCFCPLSPDRAIFAPEAFTPESAELIRRSILQVIEVPADLAARFVCNAMVIGEQIVAATAAEPLTNLLDAFGFTLTTMPMDEFMKSGGAVRCLTLPL